ncbi:MAG TPA: SGNH/GDSL hydrolase family protein [Aquihabitans sp.]|jgi:lysophospholipase L1-like esterase|nr:SGNH/GDSL hydrolase family protein [Aquihabitans sp.]
MRARHTHRYVVVTIVLSLAGLGGLTACEPPPDTYVALGDSYVSGPLILNQTGTPYGCLRSDRNYPSRVRPTIRVTKFRDVSCSGAQTDDMFAPQSVTPGPANPPQLDALDRQTKVVTLGIGGNDIGFTDIVVNCATSLPLSAGCKGDYVHDGRDELSEAIAATAPKVDRVLAAIKARAPRATTFLVGYPTVLPETGTGCYPLVPVLGSDVVYLRAKVKELNAMLQARAAAAGVTYVDIATPSIGHDFCQLPGKKWVEGLVPTADAAPVHPNAAGMAGWAPTVSARINQLVTS